MTTNEPLRTVPQVHGWRCDQRNTWSEKRQWQEVASKNTKLKKKRLDHESLLSVENNSGVPPGKHQSHNGHRSCRTCHAGRDVPESETGSCEHNKEIRYSKWIKDQRLG